MEVFFYNPDEDDEGLGDAAWELASKSGIQVLSDKDLKAVVIDGGELVGAMFDSLVGDRYSFDVVVDKASRGRGVGSALIDAAMDEFESVRESGAEMVLDVVNPDMVPVLERRGLSVLDEEGGHVIMGHAGPGSVDLASAARRIALDVFPELTPGVGFHLEGDGFWDVQDIPEDVLGTATFSGYLEIQGYPSVVFETPDGDQWAQKQPGTHAPKGDDAARDELASSALHAAALRVADTTSRAKLDPNLQRSLQAMTDELVAAEVALDKAVQHGRRLETERSFDWILEHAQAVLSDFREFRKGVDESVAYALPDDEV